MQLLKVARGPMRPVHPDLSSRKRLSQLGHNSVHLHPSSGLHHRKLRITGHRNHFVRHSLLPYQKEMAIREALPDLGVINPVSTAIKWGIGPRNAPTQRRMATRIRTNQRQANTRARPRYVHYTTVEEVPAREVVTAGMFLVNQHPTIVLFDSGASHSL